MVRPEPLASNRKRFWLGVPVFLLGLIGDVLVGLEWIQEGGLPFGLETLASLAATVFGFRLMKPKRIF